MNMNPNPWRSQVPGIPDSCFERGDVPMTKEEIRTVTLAKAKIFPAAVVYDLGAGTGALAVEAALLAWQGRVFAVERELEAVELLKRNRDRFGVDNLTVVPGEAPGAIKGLPPADVILVGGSGGHLEQILKQGLNNLKPGGRMVVNAVTLETLAGTVKFAAENRLGREAVSVAVTRLEANGRVNLWRAQNPVHVITLKKPPENQRAEEV